MSMPKLRGLFNTYASAVAFVSVETHEGEQSIGSAFHVGEGVFITARHVVQNTKIRRIATTRRKDDSSGVVVGTLKQGPLFHPNDDADVALLIVDGIDAPAIPLGGHLDDWLGEEMVLYEVVVMGYPPIPFSKEPILVGTTAETNAVVRKYTGGHPHFILSSMARGGFSGGPVITDLGYILGVVTESLGRNDQPAELGYHAVLTVEPIYSCMEHHGVTPKAVREQWGHMGKLFWDQLEKKKK